MNEWSGFHARDTSEFRKIPGTHHISYFFTCTEMPEEIACMQKGLRRLILTQTFNPSWEGRSGKIILSMAVRGRQWTQRVKAEPKVGITRSTPSSPLLSVTPHFLKTTSLKIAPRSRGWMVSLWAWENISDWKCNTHKFVLIITWITCWEIAPSCLGHFIRVLSSEEISALITGLQLVLKRGSGCKLRFPGVLGLLSPLPSLYQLYCGLVKRVLTRGWAVKTVKAWTFSPQ